MGTQRSQAGSKAKGSSGSRISILNPVTRTLSIFYHSLAPRAYSVIMFGALFCTLAVKFFHSLRHNCVNEYFSWVLADVAVLLGIELILALTCFHWPRKSIIRMSCIFAAIVCTWAVMNAGWLIRTGTQILPTNLLSLVRDPLNAFGIIGVNLVKMPAAAVILLGPSAIGLFFFFLVLVRPRLANYNSDRFKNRIIISFIVVVVAALAHAAVAWRGTLPITSVGMRYNCHLRAVTSLLPDSARLGKSDLAAAKRKIPTFDQLQIRTPTDAGRISHNLVIVVLEGIQYNYTSLAGRTKVSPGNLTPYLASLAAAGAEFPNARSTLTHTTKVLFSLLTGRFASARRDLAEAVPVAKPYASIATILKGKLNFRTAFFQSAKGNFECRPGLVHNLGFDKFWTRENLNNTDTFLGSLGSDEFSMLKPIVEWIKADERPFFLTVLCSVTHDPYEVPEWFADSAKKPIDRYQQAIRYTDSFIAALDAELAKLNLTEQTVFCVVGDHGEAFGEHGLHGHERIAFEEVLRIPFCLRAPSLVEPGTRIENAVSSIDLAPTLLAILGFDIDSANFDGINVLRPVPQGRKVYFSDWEQRGPAGFVKANRKFIYNRGNKTLYTYDLSTDPCELSVIELAEQEEQRIADEIVAWRKNTIFHLDQQRIGRRRLFGSWHCRWTDRICSARYIPEPKK